MQVFRPPQHYVNWIVFINRVNDIGSHMTIESNSKKEFKYSTTLVNFGINILYEMGKQSLKNYPIEYKLLLKCLFIIKSYLLLEKCETNIKFLNIRIEIRVVGLSVRRFKPSCELFLCF